MDIFSKIGMFLEQAGQRSPFAKPGMAAGGKLFDLMHGVAGIPTIKSPDVPPQKFSKPPLTAMELRRRHGIGLSGAEFE